MPPGIEQRQEGVHEPVLDSREISPTPSRAAEGSESEEVPRSSDQTTLVNRLQPILVLENTGSVARDHLASERTFLAYVRTSLGIAGAGVALVQLFSIASTSSSNEITFFSTPDQARRVARPLGATTIFFGFFVLVIGTTRFFSVQHALTKGKFPAARIVIAAITLILTVIVLVVFAILVSGKF